ncbi:S1 family peptidase [Paenibacillus sp. SAFN-117]|uniref:S1 family peptidase n=1 Tax=Paenibacillus sp. SAFN-117 TaxID=3436860 RepID=UPI003F7F0320
MLIKRKSLSALVLSVALLVPLLSYQGSTRAESADQLAESEEFEKNISYRAIFGLNQEPNYVKEVMETNKISLGHGVALTPNEEKELNERFQRQRENKPKILNYLKEDKSYAWLYIDQANGGIINIGFKDSLLNKEEEIRKVTNIYGDSSKIKFHEAKYSEDELRDLGSKIFEQMHNELEAKGIHLTVQTDIPSQKVEVLINPYDQSIVDELKQKYSEDMLSFGKSQEFKLDASRTDKIRPINGGVRIYNSDMDQNCTAGFSATKNGQSYLVTAGHCLNTNDYITQGGEFIGLASGTHQGGNNDSGIISIPSSIASKYVYKYQPNDTLLTSAQPSNSDNVGDRVCLSGQVTGYSCGTITNVDVWDSIAGKVYQHVRKANYAVASGDSGGTIFDGSVLKGIHFASSGSSGNYSSYFSHVSAVLSQWNLSF